jgi:hypothetical protein
MTFGYGFHSCIGNMLARIEGRIALDEILNRFPEWDVDLPNARLDSTSTVRGWATLPAYAPGALRSQRPRSKISDDPTPAAEPDAAEAERWKTTLETPMGPQEMTLYIVREGETLAGKVEGRMGSEPLRNGKIAGDRLSWTIEVKKPTSVKLSFEVTVQGDTMSGYAKLGMFGKAEVKAERLQS